MPNNDIYVAKVLTMKYLFYFNIKNKKVSLSLSYSLKFIKKNNNPRCLITNLSQQQIYKATFIHFEDISNPNSTYPNVDISYQKAFNGVQTFLAEPSAPIILITKYSKLLLINVVTYFYYSTITQPNEVAGQNFTGLH